MDKEFSALQEEKIRQIVDEEIESKIDRHFHEYVAKYVREYRYDDVKNFFLTHTSKVEKISGDDLLKTLNQCCPKDRATKNGCCEQC